MTISRRWDGKAWREVQSVWSKDDAIISIWGSDRNSVWTVGRNRDGRERIAHWNGTDWAEVYLGTSPSGPLTAISGSGPDNVWVLKDSGIRHVLAWDGKAWAEGPPVPPGFTGLRGAWFAGPRDVWAVGGERTGQPPRITPLLHWDGVTWTETPTPVTAELHAIWGSRADDIWAVGENDTILHWDGKAWSLSE